MKIECINCKNVFDFEENKGVCPKCKQFHTLQKNNKKVSLFVKKSNISNKNNKINNIEKNSNNNKNKKTETRTNIDNIKKSEKNTKNINNQKTNEIKKEKNKIINRKEDTKQKKYIIMFFILFLIIIINPIINNFVIDKAEKIGGKGILISSTSKNYVIDEGQNIVLAIKEVGYTNKGKLYVQYESNIYGFNNYYYDINIYVNDENGNTTILKYLKSDFGAKDNGDYYTYVTRAISDYTKDMVRPVSLRIVATNTVTETQISYTYPL